MNVKPTPIKPQTPSAADILAELQEQHSKTGRGGKYVEETAVVTGLAQECFDKTISKRILITKVKELKEATGLCWPGVGEDKTPNAFSNKLDEVYTQLKEEGGE